MMRPLLGLLLYVGLAQSSLGQGSPTPAPALRPGDVIELVAWRDSLLSGKYPVDEHGRVLLPILGERRVDHAPWRVVHDSLMGAFSRELRPGEIRIIPKRRVLVLGFAGEPGLYFAEPTAELAAIVASAGGAAPEGDLQRIRVVRDGDELWRAVSIESPEMRGLVHSGDQIFVGRRGWFDRNAPFFVSALVSLAGIVVTLLVAR